MRIRVFDSPHDAGIYVAALAERVIVQRPQPVLGLATGRTPIPFYEALVRLHQCGLDLSNVIAINLDEYIGLPPDHEQSYACFMKRHLFSRTNIAPENIHIPNGVASDLAQECARYDAIVRRCPIDFQILGIGVNGHIGFNEPDDLLLTKTHVVDLRPETVQSNAALFERVEDVPKQAITVGMQAILQAEEIVLMAFGQKKAHIIAETVLGEIRTEVPASVLQLHKNVTVVLDKEAARDLFAADGTLRTEP
ncbi:glucosamine-6-phosphate deaminase [Alicyclobacillus cycloheptanicus]|uniref:Glucosamine-6-phosphate deaminase n=1 Tax=Alicyclobacillus cycloheptanicus TaxID=1457 RepID=A0ABT9XHR0_9BACL|nr:glucosamine-6-phosphate deaminase [Alicyclobacillus cycloheptanicus]MDQ0189851.1 glucosamine-6-phosphate deaminase [Alicyclobacillus cycloheptanicus]WDM02465.1 glucosamine-6-phosphate deaminase [Alicyclobacillus cycloheptanicus]